MATKSKDDKIAEMEQKITELKKTLDFNMETILKLEKRNAELLEAAESSFLQSPSYLQMKKEIEFLKNLNGLNDNHVLSLRKEIQTYKDEIAYLKQQLREQDQFEQNCLEENFRSRISVRRK
jgi:hypothetical protein